MTNTQSDDAFEKRAVARLFPSNLNSTVRSEALSLENARRYAANMGILMRQKNEKDDEQKLYRSAPFTLLPTPFPRTLFDQAMGLATVFNTLADNLTRDPQWLLDMLKETAAHDPFVAKYCAMTEQVYCGQGEDARRNINDDVRLHVLRSDYMIHVDAHHSPVGRLKQVELNTVACAFANLGGKVNSFHRFLLHRIFRQTFLHLALQQQSRLRQSPKVETEEGDFGQFAQGYEHRPLARRADAQGSTIAGTWEDCDSKASQLVDKVCPKSEPVRDVALAIATALERYSHNHDPKNEVFVLTVEGSEAKETNVVDIVGVDMTLDLNYGINCIKFTFGDLKSLLADGGITIVNEHSQHRVSRSTLSQVGPGRLLITHGGREKEIGVIYFRTAYTPADFQSEDDWKIRTLLEWSDAVKCPTAPALLAGTKKIQSLWCNPSVLKKYLPGDDPSHEAARKAVASTFMPQTVPSAIDDFSRAELGAAVQDPSNFILKPQREGGSHNYHGEDVKRVLAAAPNTPHFVPLPSLILMRKINSPTLSSAIPFAFDSNQSLVSKPLMQSEPVLQSISELGVFGMFVGCGTHGAYSFCGGHIIRTKGHRVSEGGITAGFGMLDSPLLVGDDDWATKCVATS
eukprot:Selendium_serpulae@DN6071_c0_g1_i5.p1